MSNNVNGEWAFPPIETAYKTSKLRWIVKQTPANLVEAQHVLMSERSAFRQVVSNAEIRLRGCVMT
ncbi:hypothetical protein COU88_02940 [Candidatus Roizmanbacteria bacterium CG10_big_fil_rev_8_21_14_0_10_39_6]|uniref:Uncharacterized protein n=1 Tax=Candidatus Roizmanbacteria bacterium CG10_big_fil_rev_8_21_14_0_10_39_6 TaxID=1974853 RepID=A0A2M8KSC8_9BACT|nr:MAG: hypothetical protein COU88_02940 [Candidatus Roizmanbacteria bacterium CG10_big_fil_rev_8_21_14_0_10_39_6]